MDSFLSTCILEEDRWALLYLALALECDMPILEAYWHTCYKLTCLHWEEETKSFRNRAFCDLLQDTTRKHLVAAFPTWQQLTRADAWALKGPMQPNQPFMQYFRVEAGESDQFMTVCIRACTCFFRQPGENEMESSFTVQWDITEPVFAVSIDGKDWHSIEEGGFPALFEAELRRLVTGFQ